MEGNRWKAVVLDLDGTLLRSDGSVSEYTLKVAGVQSQRDFGDYCDGKVLV